jgi:glycosyltransferase involved in cell wall biosynthesis
MKHPNNLPTPWEKYFVANINYHDTGLSFQQKISLVGKILFNFDAQKKLEKLINDFQPDIAHLHNVYHQLSPSIIRTLKKHKVPMVMTLHDYKLVSPNYNLFARGKIWDLNSGWRCIFDRCVKDSFTKSLVCALEGWLHRFIGSYEKVNVFIAPSRFLIKKYKELGFRREIVFLPNSLTPLAENKERPAREENTFLFFGRLSLEKGADTLIEAMALLPKENKLCIVGDGPDRKRLEELAREKGVVDRVTFLGSLYGDELEVLRKRAQAVIIPSLWYENFPYSMIESLQSGCVVISSNIGGIAERIVHKENGLLFSAGNAQALADVILSLKSLPLDAIRKKAKESVSDLTEEKFAVRLMEIYNSLIFPN